MSDHHLPIHGSRPSWFVMPIISLSVVLGMFLPQASAQQNPAAAQQDPRALDPADIFFQAWLTIRDAEKLEGEKKHADAWRKYRQAAKYYDILSRYHKNWKPHLVVSRVESTVESIKKIEPKAARELAGNQAKTQDLVEAGSQPDDNQAPTASGNARIPRTSTTPSAPLIANNPADQAVQRRVQILENDNRRLRTELTRARSSGATLGSNSEQNRLIEQIAKRDRELNTLRNILARAPLQKDMDKIERQNRTVKAEIDITARALKASQKRLTAANKDVQKYKEEAALAQKRAEDIQKNMDAQKNIDNRVVVQLRKELDSVTKLLESTRRELGAANAKVARMQRSLTESQTTIQELTQERDALRTERDTLANILKQSGSSGVQKLIAENMRLGKELKETSAHLDFLKQDNNATKDELVEAKRDLAIAKNRIMSYQQAESNSSRRIKTLERQLRDAETDLVADRSKGGPAAAAKSEEAEVLRTTVKRLIATQERQRTASKILWETYKKSQTKIPGFAKIIDEIRNAQVTLTKEEQGLVTYRQPDSEFSSPERVSLSHARTHATELEKEIASYTPTIKRFFKKERFEGVRQILEDMNERFPGHFPTLCNLGTVEVNTSQYDKAEEYFREAITMSANSSYAHHMLGLSLYEQKDFDGARNSFQHSLDLNPDNALAHIYLGNITGTGKRYQQAEQHFLTAIKLDPTLSKAYFNLSVVYLQQKKKQEATDYYAKALENGLAASPEYELKLAQ